MPVRKKILKVEWNQPNNDYVVRIFDVRSDKEMLRELLKNNGCFNIKFSEMDVLDTWS